MNTTDLGYYGAWDFEIALGRGGGCTHGLGTDTGGGSRTSVMLDGAGMLVGRTFGGGGGTSWGCGEGTGVAPGHGTSDGEGSSRRYGEVYDATR